LEEEGNGGTSKQYDVALAWFEKEERGKCLVWFGRC